MLPSHSPYQTNNSAPGGSQAHFFPTQQQIPMQAQMPTQQNPPQQMMSPQVLIPCPACPRPLFLHPICPRYSSLVLLVLALSSYIPYAPGTHPLSCLSSPSLLTSHMPQVLIPCPACPRPLFLHPICPRYSSLVLLVLALSSYIPYAPGTHPLSCLSSPSLLTSHMPQVLIPCPACPRPLFLHPICPRYSSLVLLVLALSSYIPYAPGTHPLSCLSSPSLLTSHMPQVLIPCPACPRPLFLHPICPRYSSLVLLVLALSSYIPYAPGTHPLSCLSSPSLLTSHMPQVLIPCPACPRPLFLYPICPRYSSLVLLVLALSSYIPYAPGTHPLSCLSSPTLPTSHRLHLKYVNVPPKHSSAFIRTHSTLCLSA